MRLQVTLGVVGLLVGCALSRSGARTGPGLPMTELPPSLSWCGSGPQPADAGIDPPQAVQFPSRIFASCMGVIRKETAQSEAEEEWSGDIIFGLETSEHGRLINVCVWEGTLGNTTGYAECLAQVMIRENYAMPPNLKKVPYRLVYVYK